MVAVKRARPQDIFSETEWGRLRKISGWRGLATVAHAWAVIGLAFLASALLPHPVTWVIAACLIAGRQLGLAILMHEAAHGLLHPHEKINRFVGQWLCGAVIGADLGAYRAYHLKHHKFTQQPEDPDLWLSAPFPVSGVSFRRKVMRDLTGQTFVKSQLGLLKAAFGGGLKEGQGAGLLPEGVAVARASLTRYLVTNLGLLGLLTAVGQPLLYLVWLGALATVFQLVFRIRNIAEHACTSTSEDPFSHARTTRANWLERALVAPYWVNYHAEHHLFMYVPCYHLAEAHRLLMAKGYGARMDVAPGYWTVLKTIVTRPQESPAH